MANILIGSSAPLASQGNDNDLFINNTNWTLYKKIDCDWTLIGVMAPGGTIEPCECVDGEDGNKIFVGATTPSNSLGNSGDLYLNSSNFQLFNKVGSSWVFTGTIKGIDGTNGIDGNDGNDGLNGADGDRYTTSSTDTLSLSTTQQSLTVEPGLSLSVGQDIIIAYDNDHKFIGNVDSYNSTTGALVVDVTSHTGSGTFSTWSVSLTGSPGPQGVSITGASINPSGELILTLSDSSQVNAGNVQGPQGDSPEYEWDGTSIRFRNPDGNWGSYVDLQGIPGPAGANGNKIFVGSVDPDNSAGDDGDFYINNSSWNTFLKVSGDWEARGNIKGAQGSAGNKITTSTGDPSSTIGFINGDIWINRTSWVVFELVSGSWTSRGSIRGPQGIQGIQGETGGVAVTVSATEPAPLMTGHIWIKP